MRNLSINIKHLARVEGHGNIVVDVRNGRLEECRFEVIEAPRFFEAMLKGRSFEEAAVITCRICGICSVGHTSASIRATEAAFGIEPTLQTTRLRKALLDAEFIQSHVLHVCFLVAPDFFGAPSVFPLVQTHPEVVTRALRLKRLANDACAVLAGRHIHPVACVPGGFSSLPSERALVSLLAALEAARADVDLTVEFFSKLDLPVFSRTTEYLSIGKTEDYGLFGGKGEMLVSSVGDEIEIAEYKSKVREYPVPHSTAKHVHGGSGPYMVGALARFENNHERLHPRAKAAAHALKLEPGSFNSFHNNTAQVVETVHCLEDAIFNLSAVLDAGLEPEHPRVTARAGRGVGAVEVPRGTLFHEYEYDDRGRITAANCVIPTGQNLHHLEKDMEALVAQVLEWNDEPRAALRFEMLVRAYDPCISCSTHFLSVTFRDGQTIRSYGAPPSRASASSPRR